MMSVFNASRMNSKITLFMSAENSVLHGLFNKQMNKLMEEILLSWAGVQPSIPTIYWCTSDELVSEDDSITYGLSCSGILMVAINQDIEYILETLTHELRHHWQVANGWELDYSESYESRWHERDARLHELDYLDSKNADMEIITRYLNNLQKFRRFWRR